MERVIWDLEAEGSRTNVEFDCVRDVGIPEGTEYLGHIHSHPPESEARPSSLDEGSNQVSGIRIMGIYNGDELNFFEDESVTAALDGSDSGPERLRLRVEG